MRANTKLGDEKSFVQEDKSTCQLTRAVDLHEQWPDPINMLFFFVSPYINFCLFSNFA